MKKSSFPEKEEKRSWKREILFFFYPPKCAGCHKTGYDGLCPVCRENVELAFQPKKFLASGGNGFADEMIGLFSYSVPPVQTMLFDWKENDYRDLHEILGEYVERSARMSLFPKDIDLVTFSPRRKSARRRTGLDQAECLAREVAARLGLPFEPLLARRGFSLPQHRLRGKAREKNVQNRFIPTKPLHGERVLLVDDIVTTGESAKEGARVLKGAGAWRVSVFCLARPREK